MRKHICLILAVIMVLMMMPFGSKASADTVVDYISVNLVFPNLSVSMTGQEASQKIQQAAYLANVSTGGCIDDTSCYLAYRVGNSFYSLKNSTETLDPDRYYYLVLDFDTEEGYSFNGDELPIITVNGKRADEVRWYNSTHRWADAYVRIFLSGQEFPDIPIGYLGLPGTGMRVSWSTVEGAARYKVYRSNVAEESLSYVAELTGTFCTDDKVEGGKEYSYRVYAYDKYGIQIAWTQSAGNIIYNPFIDVKTTASYFSHLMWAVRNGVIKGKTETTFDPDGNCKRCDLAVMLYRMYGKPSVSGQTIPFTDVPKSAYYYNAVVWAYNKGYIKGTSSKKFNPNGTITRQDMVVILWRINGSKVVTVTNPFKDVDESSYAYKAIMWAYKNNITSGTTRTTFSPKDNCLRYQLAVFLNKFNNIVHVI